MTQKITFPSQVFPAYPSISFEVPEDWQALAIPDTVSAAGAPQVEGQFRANVCVSVRRQPGTQPAAAIIEGITERFAEAPEFAEIGREERQVLGADGYRMEGSFSVENVGTLFQAVHIAVVHYGTVTDVIEAVATCTASQAETLVPVLREALESLSAE